MFQLHTTQDVIAETLHSLRRAHPRWDGGKITSIHKKIQQVIDEIVEEYDGSVTYYGTDPDDRHVHAAAVASRADILLTDDPGFAEIETAYGRPYEVYTSDDFFILVDDSSSQAVKRVVDIQRQYWKVQADAGKAVKGLVEALADAGCPLFSERVAKHLRTLSGPTPQSHPER
jgi:hypothetical protein